MKPRRLAPILMAGAASVMALAGGAGIAHADSNPSSPSGPSILDQILTQTPVLYVNPSDEGGPSVDWGGVGMYCQNLFVRCS
jgi:hypothetical protein